jgi:hypothetical protein
LDDALQSNLRSFLTRNPFTFAKPSEENSAPLNWLSIEKRKPSYVAFGFISLAAFETRQATPPPAFLFHSQCQTSADKMAKDNRTSTGFIRRIRPPLGDPVCDEARGISRDPNTRQLPFLTNFQLPTGFQNLAEKLMRRAHCGARDAPVQSAGTRCICPALSGRKRNLNKIPRRG